MHTLRFNALRLLAIVLLCAGLVSSVAAEDVDAPLNEVIAGEIAVGGEVDRYFFEGETGKQVTISAYLGDTHGGPPGISTAGRIRLFSPSGVLLAQPSHEFVPFEFCTNFCFTAHHISLRIDRFTLPEDGTYTIEVVQTSGGEGLYWLGISSPNPLSRSLSKTETTDTAYGVRGTFQEWTFDATAGETVGWAYLGERREKIGRAHV